MSAEAQLVLLQDPTKVARLDPSRPLTIGRARNTSLCLASWEAVAPHHAVVRFSVEHGWLVCDWGSPQGTFCRGRRVHHCQPLRDGDAIALGEEGPVLLFQQQAGITHPSRSTDPPASTAPPLLAAPATTPASRLGVAPDTAPPSTAAGVSSPASAQASPTAPNPIRGSQGSGLAAAAKSIDRRTPLQLGGREVPLAAIRSADVLSRPRHPHSFSWWVLACLGGLVLLPWPWLFWPWQIGALAAWILLGARKEHVLVLTLRDGMAHRHRFANRVTALAHRNGVRRAIGQPQGS